MHIVIILKAHKRVYIAKSYKTKQLVQPAKKKPHFDEAKIFSKSCLSRISTCRRSREFSILGHLPKTKKAPLGVFYTECWQLNQMISLRHESSIWSNWQGNPQTPPATGTLANSLHGSFVGQYTASFPRYITSTHLINSFPKTIPNLSLIPLLNAFYLKEAVK